MHAVGEVAWSPSFMHAQEFIYSVNVFINEPGADNDSFFRFSCHYVLLHELAKSNMKAVYGKQKNLGTGKLNVISATKIAL